MGEVWEPGMEKVLPGMTVRVSGKPGLVCLLLLMPMQLPVYSWQEEQGSEPSSFVVE